MIKRSYVSALFFSLALLAPAAASAQPLVRAAELPDAPRAALLAQLTQAKLAKPATFERVHAIRLEAVSLDRKKRGNVAGLAPLYRALGSDALLPMLGELVSEAQGGDVSPSVTLAIHLGLLQAIGELRDDRAVPVLAAVLDQGSLDARLVRTAAAALGNIGSDAAVDALLARTGRAGASRLPMLAGLGSCRRAKAAGALAAMLGGDVDEDTADTLVGALGDAANAWAWQTSKVAASGERDVVANLAASALVQAFVARDGRVRARAEKSLALIGSEQASVELLAARASATPSTQAAIDSLLAKLDKTRLR